MTPPDEPNSQISIISFEYVVSCFLGKNLSNVEFQALGVHDFLKLDLIWSKYSNFVNIITPKHSICNESFDEFLSNFECPSINIHNSYCSTGYPSKAFKEKSSKEIMCH